MTKPTMTHHASHLCKPSECQNKSNRLGVTGCCSAATKQGNLQLALTWWLAVNNTIGCAQSGWQPVFGHARFCCNCETSLGENLRVESVSLIPGTDRGHTGSSLWELQFVTVVMKQLSKSRKKRLIEGIPS